MQKNAKIFLAGHKGLVGSAILEKLQNEGFSNIILKTHNELDLIRQDEVEEFFAKEKPEYVILCAAKAGGIAANLAYKAEFIYENLMIASNVIHSAYKNGVKKLIFIASTTIYPKNVALPTKEDELLNGKLEPSNQYYALAKIASVALCEAYNLQYNANFITLVPVNLYGTNDSFDLQKAHVLPAILRKMHLAKLLNEKREKELLQDLQMQDISEAKAYLQGFGVSEKAVEIWGSGEQTREFLHSKDLANAVLFALQNLNASKEEFSNHFNVSTNENTSIKALAYLVKDIVGFKGDLIFNAQKNEGAKQKLTDSSRLRALGWEHQIYLKEGIAMLYEWYQNAYINTRHSDGGGGSRI